MGEPRGISVNTVSSALKRLHHKGLLEREKVSHAYVYRAAVTRAELQRQLMGGIADQFGDGTGAGFLAAFGDLAEGLMRGCIDHFGNSFELTREDISSSEETKVRFTVK